MLPLIGVMRTLNRHAVRGFNPDHKNAHWESGSWRGTNGLMPRCHNFFVPLMEQHF